MNDMRKLMETLNRIEETPEYKKKQNLNKEWAQKVATVMDDLHAKDPGMQKRMDASPEPIRAAIYYTMEHMGFNEEEIETFDGTPTYLYLADYWNGDSTEPYHFDESEGEELCSAECCGKPVSQCKCGPDCPHCDCYKKNHKLDENFRSIASADEWDVTFDLRQNLVTLEDGEGSIRAQVDIDIWEELCRQSLNNLNFRG